jgi:hypothetical protein
MKNFRPVLLIALMGTSAVAHAAPSAAEARYQQERTRCLNGQSQQTRDTCLKEAGAALAEARRGELNKGDSTLYQQNALARCQVQTGDDRTDCEKRALGGGSASGSVEGGGVLKETVTVVPAPASAP